MARAHRDRSKRSHTWHDEEIYLDTETSAPEWVAVSVVGTGVRLVPLVGATPEGDAVRVAYEKDRVIGSPHGEPDEELSQEAERGLYRHYGLEYSERRSGSGLPEGPIAERVRGPESDETATRSEEVAVGRETERGRLRKHVVTEPAQTDATVDRQDLHAEHDAVADAPARERPRGPDASDEAGPRQHRGQEKGQLLVRAGQVGLKGWRQKVAEAAAEPVARRTPLHPDQVRAVLGSVFFSLSSLYVSKTIASAGRELRRGRSGTRGSRPRGRGRRAKRGAARKAASIWLVTKLGRRTRSPKWVLGGGRTRDRRVGPRGVVRLRRRENRGATRLATAVRAATAVRSSR